MSSSQEKLSEHHLGIRRADIWLISACLCLNKAKRSIVMKEANSKELAIRRHFTPLIPTAFLGMFAVYLFIH